MLLLFREFRGRLLLAFSLPVIGCLTIIALYNFARFRDPLEFGLRYEMAASNYFLAGPVFKECRTGIVLFARVPARSIAGVSFFAPGVAPSFRCSPLPVAGPLLCGADCRRPSMWPLTLLALPALVAIRRSGDRRVTVVGGTMLLGAVSSIALIAALGLISHRFEMDFLPWFVLIACWLVGSAAPGFRLGKFVAGIAVLYSVLASLALGLRGPYDNFLQARPEAYVNLARWFSPVWNYRPLFNPRITIEAEYSFPANPPARSFPLIAAGHLGSRYLLAAEARPGDLLRITSSGSPTSGQDSPLWSQPYREGPIGCVWISIHPTA